MPRSEVTNITNPTRLTLNVPRGFSLPHTVCSYGFFILAPNYWTPVKRPHAGRLIRPLHISRNRVVTVTVTVSQSKPSQPLRIRCDRKLDRADQSRIKTQLTRMLRLDEDLTAWSKLHPDARRARFARIFRSPTLFEDIIKTMTCCNVTWPSTVRMNRLLTQHVGSNGAFPTPAELAKWTPKRLAAMCKVGYRADRIIRFAKDVHTNRIKLDLFDDPNLTTDQLYKMLTAIHGIGPFAANNILQLLGRYDRLPVDTETVRHFRQYHNIQGDLKHATQLAETFYNQYHPYQFLAYWFELWNHYEGMQRNAWQWGPDSYEAFTASNMK